MLYVLDSMHTRLDFQRWCQTYFSSAQHVWSFQVCVIILCMPLRVLYSPLGLLPLSDGWLKFFLMCYRKRHAKMQKEIEEACRDTRGVSPEEIQEGFGPVCQSTLPTKVNVKFVSIIRRWYLVDWLQVKVVPNYHA